jgi:hypothetical protein
MLPELAIVSPLIGPFVERTNLQGETTGGTHIGAAIWWTSALGSMRGDVIRCSDSNYWIERLGFAQWPNSDFEEVFTGFFSEQSPRLFDFLDEFGEFIRIAEHSTLHSRADRWLNPELVDRGFSLGHGRAHERGVTVPLVWVFRKKIKARWLGMPYIGVEYLEWADGKTKLRNGNYIPYGSFASESLRRFAIAYAATPGFRWLTDEGEARMHALFEAAAIRRAARGPRKHNRRSASEVTTLAKVRSALRRKGDSFEHITETEIRQLGDNAFLALLRSCIAANIDDFCARVVSLRSPLARSHSELVDSCLSLGLFETTEALIRCSPIVRGQFYRGYGHVLVRAAATGSCEATQWALQTFPTINARVLEYALQAAVRGEHLEVIRLLIGASETRSVKSEAMLLAFCSDVAFEQWDAAGRWLDLGLHPLSVETSEPIRLQEMLRPGGLRVLQRIFSTEPPTDEKLRRVMAGCVHGGAEADYLFKLSREVQGHVERMSDLLLNGILSFIRMGYKYSLQLLVRAAREGGTLCKSTEKFSSRVDLLRGHQWKDRQDRLITVVGELQKVGFPNEAKIVASLKRGRT